MLPRVVVAVVLFCNRSPYANSTLEDCYPRPCSQRSREEVPYYPLLLMIDVIPSHNTQYMIQPPPALQLLSLLQPLAAPYVLSVTFP